MRFRWRQRSVTDLDVVSRLQRELNSLAEPLARLLVLRGVQSLEEARLFFRGSLTDLHDPFLMQGMEQAADRLRHAIDAREHVLVFGDYDVDGVTSTALMVSFLRELGVPVSYHVPDRVEDGYGLNVGVIDRAVRIGASLIVSLDCGITAVTEAAYARTKGVDLVICDHHTPGESLPDALAVLDPKRSDCNYPFKELSGCGVGFKLVQAVLDRLGLDPASAFRYLDLVAISAASDIVPVIGENRLLMREGFRLIEEAPRPGLAAMAACSNLSLNPCNSGRIVFGVGPRLNAAGRMAGAGTAVELLLADSLEKAAPMAADLERVNLERRALDEQILEQAIEEAERAMPRNGLVLYRPDWHPGIIGIVASRIVERFYRPTVMLCMVNGKIKGSARSIEGVNVYDALRQCEHLLDAFGGHDYAAGVTLQEDRVEAFADAFDAAIGEAASEELFTPAINVDAELDLVDLDDRFWAVLKQFGPFGPANARPVFRASDLRLVGKPKSVGRDASHVKFSVVSDRSPGSRAFDVIGFDLGSYLPELERAVSAQSPMELLFTVDENVWRGTRSIQLQAKDLKPVATPEAV